MNTIQFPNAGVYGLTFLANRRRIRKVNLQEQFIMAYGGLRGAVGFSLVEMISAGIIPPKQMFVTTTLAVVMFTIFFQVYSFLLIFKCYLLECACFISKIDFRRRQTFLLHMIKYISIVILVPVKKKIYIFC